MIKKLLIALCIIGLVIATPIVALVVYQIYADNAASQVADDFCRQTPLGSDIALAVARSEKIEHMHHLLNDQGEFQVAFQGGIHHSVVCRIGVSGNKVISVGIRSDDG